MRRFLLLQMVPPFSKVYRLHVETQYVCLPDMKWSSHVPCNLLVSFYLSSLVCVSFIANMLERPWQTIYLFYHLFQLKFAFWQLFALLGPMLWFLKYFRRKNSEKMALLARNKAKLCKFLIITLSFEKTPFFRRKLTKIAENCDHM
jgi:hypothetical protein